MHTLYGSLSVLLWVLSLNGLTTAFQTHPSHRSSTRTPTSSRITLAAKKRNAKQSSGGGFGAAAPKAISNTISADKGSLEKQWDTFTGMTDLEITPPLSDDDDDDAFFKVVDVFVRCNVNGNDKWFRIGKVCTSNQDDPDAILAALTLQKGLIFWTAVHMRRELVAVGGMKGAASLELGYTDASMTTGSDADGPVEQEEEKAMQIAERVSVKDVSIKTVGFRPDWNPPGFTYKRRESAAMKKKKTSGLEEIASVGAGDWNIGGVESESESTKSS